VTLILRPFGPDDEEEALLAHRELAAEDFEFLWSFTEGQSWTSYLSLVARYGEGRDLPSGHVQSALLVADVDGQIVGRVSVRFELNEFLLARGGHIGYAVRPAWRRRGYASEILRQGLAIARDRGIDPVLVTCDDTNVASAAVIERAGGSLESIFVDPDSHRYRRYWITATS